ncbi:MAG: hypothetical protein Q9191_007506 [Dirinaria sp. TL-2023a]
MLHLTSTNGHAQISNTTDPGNLEEARDGTWISNPSKITHEMLNNERGSNTISHAEPQVSIPVPTAGDRGPMSGSVGKIHVEKVREQSPRTVIRRPSTARSSGRKPSSKEEEPASMRNGTNHTSMVETSIQAASKKRKKGGLGTVIRRLFGRRSVKNRISLPAPVNHQKHDPHTFITSPSDLKPQRAASVPSANILRTSALGSHSPFVLSIPKDSRISNNGVPKQPERPPPERPARPRRASLPSVILSSQEAEDINNALTGLGLHDGGDQVFDGRDIGFAITSGSNPKRRSRSVGDYRSTAKEHRMSPIQWRQWRRRSDEIKYWRESATGDEPASSGRSGFIETEHEPTSADPATKAASEPGGEGDRPFEAHSHEFNFGLPISDIQGNEHIGLEERMITLELKLMDFDYAISKLQAGSFPPLNRHGRVEAFPTGSAHTRSVSDQPQIQSSKAGGPFVETSPSLTYYHGDENPGFQGDSSLATGPDLTTIQPRPRPASIATTLKASGAGHYSSSGVRSSIDRSSRSSITQLTIEHYTTLITLIRREQSARMRLEDQVTQLQRQVEALEASSSSPRSRREQQALGRHFSPDDICRPYGFGFDVRQRRGRSSNYSGDTDTDDDNFHEVYVTPVERGEFERDDFDGEEGVAF